MLRSRLEAAALGLYGPPEALVRLSVIPERLIHGKVTEGGRTRRFLTLKLAFRAEKLLKKSPVFLLDALLGSALATDHRESRNIFPVLLGWRLFQRSSVIRGKTRPPLGG